MEIKGKIALVTGGAKRVGREIAIRLAKQGASIALHYKSSEPEAAKTAEAIRSLGVDCHLFKADLSDAKQTLDMAEKAYAQLRSIDVLVNNASVYYKTPIGQVNEADWDRLIAANLKGPFLLSTTIGNRMAQKNGGKIVNIADWSGFRPYRDFGPYCISKGGLITLTKSLARDLAPKVQCNAIAPGPVLAPPGMPEEERAAIARTTALGRWGSPGDVAGAVAFLIENDFINGTVLVVDGGRSIV